MRRINTPVLPTALLLRAALAAVAATIPFHAPHADEAPAAAPEVFNAVEDSLSTSAAAPAPESVGGTEPSPAPSSAAAPSPKPGMPRKPKAPKIDKAPIRATSKNLPALLQEVEAKYAKAATLQAEFSQVNEVAAMGTKKTSSGVILVKRPDKLRWETLKPDMNLLVSDGRKFWFYTPPFEPGERGQVIVRRSNQTNSKLANALLSGHFSVAREMRIEQQGTSRFVLTPKPRSAGTVIKAEIEIDPGLKLIQKVVLDHQGGNRSEITLSKIELGKALGDEAFAFTPPPNTDEVKQ